VISPLIDILIAVPIAILFPVLVVLITKWHWETGHREKEYQLDRAAEMVQELQRQTEQNKRQAAWNQEEHRHAAQLLLFESTLKPPAQIVTHTSGFDELVTPRISHTTEVSSRHERLVCPVCGSVYAYPPCPECSDRMKNALEEIDL
jgi:hypothetical protein